MARRFRWVRNIAGDSVLASNDAPCARIERCQETGRYNVSIMAGWSAYLGAFGTLRAAKRGAEFFWRSAAKAVRDLEL